MAFFLKASNSLDHLATALCANLQSAARDAFQPFYIITQTEGMNNWLNFQMADKLRIAANCRFLKPTDLIFKIYYLLGGASTQTLSAENLAWVIYGLLGESAFKDQFPEIARYYDSAQPAGHSLGIAMEDKAIKDVKRLTLAKKIADLFDQYQIYRPDMLQAWDSEAGPTLYEGAMQLWQRYLWLKAKDRAAERFPNKIQMSKEIEQAMQDPDKVAALQKNLPAIYFFGISLMTEFHLRIFEQLSDYVHLYLYLHNPAPEDFWLDEMDEKKLAFLKKLGKIPEGEQSMGNPLLLGWGKIIKETFSMLFKNESILNGYEVLPVSVPEEDSLLHKIQLAIFQNTRDLPTKYFTETDLADESLCINACYSPIREVEVLYNYLVHLVDQRRERLSPRDIVVMVSDIDLYGSYIKAVFDHAPYKFPFKIADESYVFSDSISGALQSILNLEEPEFTAEAVVRLLDSSYIKKRWEIEDMGLIRHILNEANIRFGMNGDLSDDSLYVSWRYGLKRMIYGICMSGAEEFGSGDWSFYPIDSIEGSTALDAIRFAYFVENLMESIEQRKTPRTLTQWSAYVEDVLQNFICNEEDITDEDYLLLLAQLEDYNTTAVLFEETVSYGVFMESFLNNISGAARNRNFGTGGITFCSLIPMRSIPFKVVALLGLDDDKFPRKEHPLGFNIMEKKRRPGDRNVKENDKHLFLETLLSAKQYLYISYIGQSIKDNSPIPPSSLVDELVEYIAVNSSDPDLVRKDFIVRHPLHGFSKRYFSEDPRLYTYLVAPEGPETSIPQGPAAAKSDLVEPAALDTVSGQGHKYAEVSLDKLIKFLQQPIKGYYNDVLGIYYSDSESTLRDTEIFELDSLQKWQLRNKLLLTPSDAPLGPFKDKLLKTGQLPLKNMASWVIQQTKAEVEPIKALLDQQAAGQQESSLTIDLSLSVLIEGQKQPCRLTGIVHGIFGKKMILVSWSRQEGKYLLMAYIQHLAVLASGIELETCLISREKEAVFYGEVMDQQSATRALGQLLQLYIDGHQDPLPFIAGLSDKPMNIEDLEKEHWANLLKAKLYGYGIISDPYHQKADETGLFDAETAFDKFKELFTFLEFSLHRHFPHYFKGNTDKGTEQ